MPDRLSTVGSLQITQPYGPIVASELSVIGPLDRSLD